MASAGDRQPAAFLAATWVGWMRLGWNSLLLGATSSGQDPAIISVAIAELPVTKAALAPIRKMQWSKRCCRFGWVLEAIILKVFGFWVCGKALYSKFMAGRLVEGKICSGKGWFIIHNGDDSTSASTG